MISIYTLIVFFGAATLIEYFFLKSDLLSPGMLYCLSFLVCSICAWCLSDAWNIKEIHLETFRIIIFCSLLFLIIEATIRFSLMSTIIRNNHQELKYIPISESIIWVEIILLVICIIWALAIIFRTSNFVSLNSLMAIYKDSINHDATSLGISKKILNQFGKVCIALAYILMFVFHNNKSIKRPDSHTIKLNIVVAALFFLFRLLLSGSRQGSLGYLMSWITCSYVCRSYNQTKRKLKRTNRRFIGLFVAITTIVFPMFYYVGRLVGRKESKVLYAATAYLASGLYGLEWEVKNNYSTPYWGRTSFGGLFPILKFFGVIPSELKQLSFLPMTLHGNTVTIYGRWYWDFKIIGCIVMISIVSAFFALLYYRMMRFGKNANIYIIIYCYCINILFFIGYDDYFFNIPTLNTLLILFIFLILYHYICDKHLRIKIGCFREKNDISS